MVLQLTMKRDEKCPKWWYEETDPVGVDYSSAELVQRYDDRHQKLRDYEKNSEIIINRLGLDTDSTVIDLGAGTGAFALYAAKQCRKVYAVDVSAIMLDYCRTKGETEGLRNIVYCHGGFLTYEHDAAPVDAIVSILVLHHLPDFWKLVGLKRAAEMLKPDDRLFLCDIVFPSETANLEAELNAWVTSIAKQSGPELAAEAETHIREEYSTYDWVMEGLLARAGFEIENAESHGRLQATYVCAKSGP